MPKKAGQYGSLSQILYANNRLPPHMFRQDSSFASSANQRWFASFSPDQRLSLWQFDGSHEKAMTAHIYPLKDQQLQMQAIKKLHFSPAARYLVGLSQQGQLIWWKVDSGEQLNMLDQTISNSSGHDSKTVVFSGNGKRLVSLGKDGGLMWWDSQQAQTMHIKPHFIPEHHVQTIQFNPNGERLVSLDDKGAIIWWEGQTGVALSLNGNTPQKAHVIDKHHITQMYFTPTGKHLITLGREGNLFWWDSVTGKPLTKHPIALSGQTIVDVLISPKRADSYVVTRSSDGDLAWWDAETGKRLVSKAPHSSTHKVAKIAFTPKGDLLSISEEGSLQFWDKRQQRKKQQKIAEHAIDQLIFNAETSYFVSLDKSNGSLMWWNAATAQAVTRRPKNVFAAKTQQVYFSPNGQHLVTLDEQGNLQWWDGETGVKKQQQSVTFSSHTIQTLRFGHLSQQLISIGKEGSLVWWNLATGEPYLNDANANIVNRAYA